MTPMVDVAFLLLIFFMCTPVLRKPQALEINLPPDPNAKVEIAESNAVAVRDVAGREHTCGDGRPAGGGVRGPFRAVDAVQRRGLLPTGRRQTCQLGLAV